MVELTWLPIDILSVIASFVRTRELGSYAMVCHDTSEAVLIADDVWNRLLLLQRDQKKPELLAAERLQNGLDLHHRAISSFAVPLSTLWQLRIQKITHQSNSDGSDNAAAAAAAAARDLLFYPSPTRGIQDDVGRDNHELKVIVQDNNPLLRATSFDDMGLDEELREGIDAMIGPNNKPLPAQQLLIPTALYRPIAMGNRHNYRPSQRNIHLVDRPGTGKTTACAIVMLQRILSKKRRKVCTETPPHVSEVSQYVHPSHSVEGLYICPTREITLQTSRAISTIGSKLQWHEEFCESGVPISKYRRALRSGNVLVLVATIGQFLSLMLEVPPPKLQPSTVIVGEVDMIISVGFAAELAEMQDKLFDMRDRYTETSLMKKNTSASHDNDTHLKNDEAPPMFIFTSAQSSDAELRKLMFAASSQQRGYNGGLVTIVYPSFVCVPPCS